MAQIIIAGSDIRRQISGIEIYIEVDYNNDTVGLERKLQNITEMVERLVSLDLELAVNVRELSIKDDLFNLENSL